eukprot:TRINITY_DN2066_c0_g1_i4.p1 TRINITY_DN2066_c0_g1~~TRINITY_DN2066_c0_g1_i4.p1  ORF type:complete len:675 (+),score=144.27 TRINITY_DN2066_c0_g1_i4:94-2118(+)
MSRVQSLQTCLQLLRGSQDEHKVAALLLLPKCMQDLPREEIPKGFCRLVFEVLTQPTVDQSFLYRLFHTETQGYKELALHIVDALLAHDIDIFKMDATKPILMLCLKQLESGSAEIASVCYRMIGVIRSPESQVVAMDFLPSNILDTLISGKNGFLLSDDETCRTQSFAISNSLIEMEDERITVDATSFVFLIQHIHTHNDSTTFQALSLLSSIFHNRLVMSRLKESLSSLSSEWVTDLRDIVTKLLLSRLRDTERVPCFGVIHGMLRLHGPSWISNQVPVSLSAANQHAHLVDLVLQLLQTELRLLIQEDIYQTSKYQAPIFQHFVTCLDLADLFVDFLDRYDEWQDLPGNVVMRLTAAVVECVKLALHFLHLVVFDQKQEASLLVLKCVRIIGSWVSRDVEYYVEDIFKAMPVILERISRSEYPVDSISLLIPGLSQYLCKKENVLTFLDTESLPHILEHVSGSLLSDVLFVLKQLRKSSPENLQFEKSSASLVDFIALDDYIMDGLYALCRLFSVVLETCHVKATEVIGQADTHWQALNDALAGAMKALKKYQDDLFELYVGCATVLALSTSIYSKQSKGDFISLPHNQQLFESFGIILRSCGDRILEVRNCGETEEDLPEDGEKTAARLAYLHAAYFQQLLQLAENPACKTFLVEQLVAKNNLVAQKAIG